jgi:hypothetical protein
MVSSLIPFLISFHFSWCWLLVTVTNVFPHSGGSPRTSSGGGELSIAGSLQRSSSIPRVGASEERELFFERTVAQLLSAPERQVSFAG